MQSDIAICRCICESSSYVLYISYQLDSMYSVQYTTPHSLPSTFFFLLSYIVSISWMSMNFLNTQISNTPAILHVMLCVCLSQFMHSIDDAGARSHFLNTFSFSNVYANLHWNRENMFSFTFDRFVNILFTCECEVGIQVARSTRLEIKTFSRLDKHITSLALDHQTIRETHIGLFLYSTTTEEQIISVAITSLTLFSFKKIHIRRWMQNISLGYSMNFNRPSESVIVCNETVRLRLRQNSLY